MLIYHMNARTLKGMDWYMEEFTSEATTEGTLRRLVREIPNIFRESPCEVFAPIKRRDLGVFELGSGPYIFVRSQNYASLLRLKTITGVLGLITSNDSGHANQAVRTPDAFVQELILKDDEAFKARSAGVKAGSFVRILESEVRDFCGTVTAVNGDRADVTVELKTRKIFVNSPVVNLLNLGDVPGDQRVFFYCDMVRDDLIDTALIAEDLHMLPPVVYTEEEIYGGKIKGRPDYRPRVQTVTRAARERANLGDTPREMLDACVAGMADGYLRKPANASIFYNIIKQEFLQANKKYKKWHDVKRNARDAVKKDDVFAACVKARLGIPAVTPEDAKVDDGRRRGRPMKA